MAGSTREAELDELAEGVRATLHPDERAVESARLVSVPRFGLVSSATITEALTAPVIALLTDRHLVLTRVAAATWTNRIHGVSGWTSTCSGTR